LYFRPLPQGQAAFRAMEATGTFSLGFRVNTPNIINANQITIATTG
jgi:hypothetical protein